MTSQADKCKALQQLHNGESAWIIPNPWDVGSAKIMQNLGFKALATTSAGYAYTLGKSDGEISLAEKLQHCTELAAATNIPINADFENGFADDPAHVAANVRRVAETGVAGCSIEDYSRDSKTLYDFDLAVERVQAAAEAVASLGIDFQLTARAENLLRGVDDLDATIRRLQAFEKAGAHVLYAPALNNLDQVKTVSTSVTRPINVLAAFLPAVSLAEYTDAGANRISLGSAINNAVVSPLIAASHEMLEKGTFSWLANATPGAEISKLLK